MNKEEAQVLESIDIQAKEMEKDEILDFIFDGTKFKEFTPKIKEKLEIFGARLSSLSANDCGLKNLNNFPNLPGLIQVNTFSSFHFGAISFN